MVDYSSINEVVINPGASRSRFNTAALVVKMEPNLPPRENPFYSRVIDGIEESCQRFNIKLLFTTLLVDDYNVPVEIPDILTNQEADGFMMVGAFIGEAITSMNCLQNRPIVLVDAYSNSASFDTVVSDNYQTAYQAVEYLIRKGHRHIGLVGSEPASYPSLRQRRAGHTRALKDNELNSSYIANFNINKENAHDPVIRLMGEHPQITALFGVNDEVAVRTITTLQEMGLRVPQDVSVIGYDDINLAMQTTPALTTFHVDTLAMGRTAVSLLISRWEYPESGRMTLIIHPTLVERDSVAEL